MPVRPAQAGDGADIAHVQVATWRTAYRGIVPADFLAAMSAETRAPWWERQITDHPPDVCTFVACDTSEQVVGFAHAGSEHDGDPTHTGELYAIYVLEEHQRRGLGRELVRCVALHLRGHSHQAMLVWALAANPYRRFYETLGGTLLRARPIEIGGTVLEEVAYGYDLDALLARLDARSEHG
jgi:GNAT superfamily N-acetyltransferase